MDFSEGTELQGRCEVLRGLHRPGEALLLPNVWDVATARATVAAGFPVVATTSGGVAATLGYEDNEGAPGEEMLAAGARIVRAVEVPVTVDVEGGYGMEPGELVSELRAMGAAGCNIEDTDHKAGGLRESAQHAEWLAEVRRVAKQAGYPLFVNARVDVFLGPIFGGADDETLTGLVPEAVERANAYLAAGADCAYPIAVWQEPVLRRLLAEVQGPINVTRMPQAPSIDELAKLGVARVSWATFLHLDAMTHFEAELASIKG